MPQLDLERNARTVAGDIQRLDDVDLARLRMTGFEIFSSAINEQLRRGTERIVKTPPPREYDDCLHCGCVPIDHVCTWKNGF
jgi:hypothetical protein